MKQQSLPRAIRNDQRWMEMLINGEAKNITDLAAKPGLKPPYGTRILGLNTPAPNIVEAIVAGAEPDGVSIAQIMKTFRKTGTNNGGFSVSRNNNRPNPGGRRNPDAFLFPSFEKMWFRGILYRGDKDETRRKMCIYLRSLLWCLSGISR